MIHPRVQLVTAEVVATMRGIPRELVYELVDGGTDSFMWVFNVSTSPRLRDPRFWTRELREPVATQIFGLEEVIQQLVPRRDQLPGQFCGLPKWQLGDLLRVSRRQLLELADELPAEPHLGGMFVRRSHIEAFFRRRWLFANVVRHSCAAK